MRLSWTQCKENCAERKPSFLRSSSSNECKTTNTSEEIDDSTDTTYSDKRLRDGREGVYLTTEWQYIDLKSINIFYNEKPDPIKDLMQDVKTGLIKNYPNFPNFENSVAKFSSFTKECLLFSCDFDKIVDRIKDQVDRITSRQVGQDAFRRRHYRGYKIWHRKGRESWQRSGSYWLVRDD